MITLFVFVATVLQISSARLNIRRPENGIGNLFVSSDSRDKEDDYNKERLMIFFDMDCMESSSVDSHITDKDFDYSSIQQSALDSIIKDHYPCLSHTKGRKGKINHWQFKDVDIEEHIDHDGSDLDDDFSMKSLGVSFLDIKDATSMKDNSDSCLHDQSVQLDYNKHCISIVTYEPLLKLSGDGYNWTNYEYYGYECFEQNVSQFWYWGLDALDSTYLDGSYYYPNSSVDNGVDLYILDDGVLSTHYEFETGQVTGDEPENSECEANHGIRLLRNCPSSGWAVWADLIIMK